MQIVRDNAKPRINLREMDEVLVIIPFDRAMRAPLPWLEGVLFEVKEANKSHTEEADALYAHVKTLRLVPQEETITLSIA